MYKTVTRHSSISGKGTFITENVRAGEFIKQLTGEPVPVNQILQICAERGVSWDDPLQIDENTYLILDEYSTTINHSCDPNVCLRNKNDLYAIKDIKAHEELIFDYSTTEGIFIPWSMKCACGAKQCRKVVGNVLSIPRDTLQKYIKLHALQNHILRQLKICDAKHLFDEKVEA
ncbi:MAG: nuclear protein SET [uncultured bacterium]|nr:MAG: nuclear protein SET [uncultured bacterium]